MPSVKQLEKDYVDMYFTLHDNGDNKVWLECYLGTRKQINILCDMYLPVVSTKKEER